MRRKSSRNTKVSPEKPKPETQRKSRRQSSRRRKHSSSRSSEESDEPQPDTKGSLQILSQSDATSTDIKSDSDTINDKSEPLSYDNEIQDEANIDSKNSVYVQEHSSVSNKEVVEDSQEGKEGIEDMEETKNKGKSKGKNISNFEPSSNNLEPETENENVQGTHQSPSNDYADNENVVQNVNDTPQFDSEPQESDKIEETASQNEDQQQNNPEAGFESEYVQKNQPSGDNETNTESKNVDKTEHHRDKDIPDPSHKNRDEESKATEDNITRETSEERKGDDKLKIKPSSEKSDKSERRDSSGSKKKITLRRSPPENKIPERIVSSDSSAVRIERSSSTEEIKEIEEGKRSSKKITLKRHTTDDSTTNEAQADNKNASISRSMSEEIVERKRRLSSMGDDKEPTREDKPKKVFKQIKLIRNLSRDTNDEETTKRVTLRRQRWAGSDWLNKLTSSFYKVDIESIKIVCPSLEFLNEDEVNLESSPKERRRSESEHKRKMSIDNRSEDSDRPDYEKQISEDSSGEPKVEPNPNIIAMNRKISIVDDTASKLKPPPSPSKNPTSDVLFITNLVRPFTIKQLKELLERTGKIKEEGFWTDRIKSKCYVQYESAEEAEATRNALHGVHWPIGNGKKLVIDYATAEDLENAKNPVPAPVVVPEKLPEKENREPEREDVKGKDMDREDRRKRDAPVREWDLGKEEPHRRFSRSRSRSRERARKHSRRSYTPEEYINKKQRKHEDSVPQKLMDDLFLKTKATPSIYWQPLSPEEIVTKQQQRLVRMEEHKRRIEENRGRGRDNRRIPFRRR